MVPGYQRLVVVFGSILSLVCYACFAALAVDDASPTVNQTFPGFSCDFDDGTYCIWRPWTEETSDTCMWTVEDQLLKFQADNCGTDRETSVGAVISTVLTGFTLPSQCLQFRYYMAGAAGNLWVLVVPAGYDPQNDTFDDDDKRTEFLRKGNQGRYWHNAAVTIDSHGATSYQLVIMGARGISNNSAILMDDLVFNDGACLDDYHQCDFESSQCDYLTDTATGEFEWMRDQARNYVPGYDHTFSAPEGHVLVANGTGLLKGAKTTIKSKRYKVNVTTTGAADHCFTFWYQTPGRLTEGQLSVLIDGDTFPETFWFVGDGFEGAWEYAAVPVHDTSEFFATFEAVNGNDSIYLIDDIVVTVEPCIQSFICSFEDNECGWTNSLFDSSDWVRTTPESAVLGVVPGVDHSTGTQWGYYMGVESESTDRAVQAHLTSPRLPKEDKDMCFAFWYFISSTSGEFNSSSLDILLLTPGHATSSDPTERILSLASVTASVWVHQQLPFRTDSEVRLSFLANIEGELGQNIIALDDFSDCSTISPTALPSDSPSISAVTEPSVAASTFTVTSAVTSIVASSTPEISLSSSPSTQTEVPTAYSSMATSATTHQPCSGFWCSNISVCYAAYRVCDGHTDCPDGADETSCTLPIATMSDGSIAGIVIGVLLALVAVGAIGFFARKRWIAKVNSRITNNTYLNFNDLDEGGVENQAYSLDHVILRDRMPAATDKANRSNA